jgi:asparagine synthetase B (glutamine-hydrolysing)
MKTCGIQPAELEVEVSNHIAWRAKVKEDIHSAKEKRELEREEKRTIRHQKTQPVPSPHTTPTLDYTNSKCQRS